MSVKIAIIDSGVNPDHFHVQGIEKGFSFYQDDKKNIVRENDFTDKIGHGTAIAGIIKKKAPFAKLYAIKIFYKNLTAPVSVLIKALNWAIESRMQIINLSLGTQLEEYEKDLRKICAKAYKKNIFLISSAKNLSDITFPSIFETVIGVYWNRKCNEESLVYHPESLIEFGACGSPRALPGLPQSLNFSGSSFAAAHVTGEVAIELKDNPTADIKSIKKALAAQSNNRHISRF
jgi:subtilisin family serine protease